LVKVFSDTALKLCVLIGRSYKSHEMPARGRTGDGNGVSVDFEMVRIRPKEANGRLDIMDLSGEGSYWRESVVDTRDGVTVF
jgi:hypothetical protein